MKFAIPLSMLPMDEIKSLGIAADEIGYDFLAVSDHLIHPENFSVPVLIFLYDYEQSPAAPG